jgi:hypothetical protein
MNFNYVTLESEVPNLIYCQALGIIYSNLSVQNILTDFELQDEEYIYHFILTGCSQISGVVSYINDFNTKL